MKIREELFDHPDWWKTNYRINDLNETNEEFHNRIDYLRTIEPNPIAISETTIGDEEKLSYESVDEFRARLRNDYLLVDMGCNEEIQDGFYLYDENIKKTC